MRARSLFALALPILFAAGDAAAQSVTRADIPDQFKWKPEHIYTSAEGWEADLQAVRSGVDQLAAFKGRFAGPEATDPAASLIEYNRLSKEIEIKFDHLGSYVGRNYDVDLSSNEWSGRSQRLRDLGIEYSQKLAWFEPELLQIPEQTLMKWVGEHADLAPYRRDYEDMYLLQKHVLSPAEEEILALAGNITGTTGDVYGKFTNVDMDCGTIVDEKGDTIKCTYTGWTSYRTSKDRRVREDYFNAVWKQYKGFGNTLAALMAGNVKKDIFLTKARKFANTLARALDASFVPEQVYTSLVSSTRANLAPLHKYDAIRKRVLGVDHYRHSDYYVNLVEGPEKRYSWDDGVAMILDALRPLGQEITETVGRGLNPANGWVDAYATDNKRGGAYSGNAYAVHPFMLFNFDYRKGLTLDDISAVAHEVGHSMHTYWSEKTQPFPMRGYAIFNAEVASTTFETLMAMKLLDQARSDYRNAKGKAKEEAKQRLLYLLEQNVNNGRDTFFRQTMFATWEWQAHQMAEQGQPITPNALNKLYGDLLKEWHGPAAEYGELSNVSWSTVPHFYRGYYVYAYATSYAAAVALAEDIRAEAAGDASKKGAAQRFVNYLKSGGSKHPVELLQDAGVDMTTPAPIESFIRSWSKLVDELDDLTKTG